MKFPQIMKVQDSQWLLVLNFALVACPCGFTGASSGDNKWPAPVFFVRVLIWGNNNNKNLFDVGNYPWEAGLHNPKNIPRHQNPSTDYLM